MDLRKRLAPPTRLLWTAGTALLLWSCTAGDEQRNLPSSAERDARAAARACDDGDTIACHNLAVSWLHGADGLAADPAHASRLFSRNCHDGSTDSCRQAARLALPSDPLTARALLQRACDAPDPFACNELAQHLLTGLGREPEPLEAFALFELACSQHAARACVSVAQLLLDPGHPAHDEARGRPLLARMCHEGQMSACADAGVMLAEDLRRRARDEASDTGEPSAGTSDSAPSDTTTTNAPDPGVLDDSEPEAAVDPRDSAASNASPHGRDLPAELTLDPATATPHVVEELLRRGCLGGVGRSCSDLANLLREGDLLPVDVERADRLDRMAAEAAR